MVMVMVRTRARVRDRVRIRVKVQVQVSEHSSPLFASTTECDRVSLRMALGYHSGIGYSRAPYPLPPDPHPSPQPRLGPRQDEV